jgi:uncharacterized membrane protein (UPF0127 family)
MDEVKVVFTGADGTVKAAATLEIADTDETRATGLSKRAALPDGRGMFFDRAGAYWMKDVNFPLDLTFVTKEGEVLETLAMPVDRGGVFHYSPSRENAAKAAHAIETPMGFLAAHGVVPGDTVAVQGEG